MCSWKANMTIDDHRWLSPCHHPSVPFGCPWPQALLYAWSVSVSAECKIFYFWLAASGRNKRTVFPVLDLLNPTRTKTQKPTEPSKCHSQKWLNQFDDLLMTPDRLIPVHISFHAQSLPACTKRAAVNGLQANTIHAQTAMFCRKTCSKIWFKNHTILEISWKKLLKNRYHKIKYNIIEKTQYNMVD